MKVMTHETIRLAIEGRCRTLRHYATKVWSFSGFDDLARPYLDRDTVRVFAELNALTRKAEQEDDQAAVNVYMPKERALRWYYTSTGKGLASLVGYGEQIVLNMAGAYARFGYEPLPIVPGLVLPVGALPLQLSVPWDGSKMPFALPDLRVRVGLLPDPLFTKVTKAIVAHSLLSSRSTLLEGIARRVLSIVHTNFTTPVPFFRVFPSLVGIYNRHAEDGKSLSPSHLGNKAIAEKLSALVSEDFLHRRSKELDAMFLQIEMMGPVEDKQTSSSSPRVTFTVDDTVSLSSVMRELSVAYVNSCDLTLLNTDPRLSPYVSC